MGPVATCALCRFSPFASSATPYESADDVILTPRAYAAACLRCGTMKRDNATKAGATLSALLQDVERLREAEKLLERVWSEIGPYGLRPGESPKPDLLHDMREHFDFDDSE